MTARQVLRAGAAVMALTMLAASGARAQEGDPNCKDLSAETQRDDVLIARTWLPLQIAFEAMDSACKAHKFLGNLFSSEPDLDKITPDDLFEAAKPEGSEGGDAAFKAAIKKQPAVTAKSGWNPEPQAQYIVVPPINPDGQPSLFQPNGASSETAPKSISEIEGNGTLLTPEGMKRGTFNHGKLEGVGEEIDPDGVWRSGTYEAGTNIGNMFEVRTIDGKTYLAAGSAVNGKLDGMVERIYADGSRQFEEWDNGQFVQAGVRAPKGQSAIAPQPKVSASLSGDRLESRIKGASSAGALFALADELGDEGNADGAKAAFRALLSRYPNSPLATKAADRLAALGGSAGGGGGGGGGTKWKDFSAPTTSAGSSVSQGTGSYGGNYATSIREPGLPASFYARYTGHNLTKEECLSQNNALGWNTTGFDRNDTILMLRAAIALTEAGIIIIRQCENNPQAVQQMQIWATQRSASIATCRQVATDPAICLRSPF